MRGRRTRRNTHEVHSNLGSLSWRLGSGRHGLLKEHTDFLLRVIFEWREQGHGVSTNMVVRKASQIYHKFHQRKTENTQRLIVRRWLYTQKLRFHMGTNKSQRPISETKEEALDFIRNIARVKATEPNRDPRYILNMDQTPVFFFDSIEENIRFL